MVCAVVGFPLGAMAPTAKAYEAREAVRHGAHEIDMVINIGALKSRDYETVFEDICRVVEASAPRRRQGHPGDRPAHRRGEDRRLLRLSKRAGAAFVKTSTGFGKGGATVEDVALMRRVVGSDMGVKASGGVRTQEDALHMMQAGANRIGASASVAIVSGGGEKQKDGGARPRRPAPTEPWVFGARHYVVLLEAVGIERVILLVMDSVGAGATPDAERYGDAGANTLGHVAEAAGGARPADAGRARAGQSPADARRCAGAVAAGAFGKMAEASAGKDTATGHWELAGLRIERPFRTFPDGFPEEILEPFRRLTGRGVIGNRAASGTEIIQELGDQHRQTGDLIVYTSADSVFQIAAHEETVPIEEQYRICRIARDILDPYDVGRVIARPFVGARKGEYARTYNRKDFAVPPPEPTLLDRLTAREHPGHRGRQDPGHLLPPRDRRGGPHRGQRRRHAADPRGDAPGRARPGVRQPGRLRQPLRPPARPGRLLPLPARVRRRAGRAGREIDPGRDLVIITADHGNDPTFPGSDHTREYVPLIAFGPAHAAGVDLGVRATFADVGATVADIFQVAAPLHGASFLRAIA